MSQHCKNDISTAVVMNTCIIIFFEITSDPTHVVTSDTATRCHFCLFTCDVSQHTAGIFNDIRTSCSWRQQDQEQLLFDYLILEDFYLSIEKFS
jgi:hypothetical protein